MKEVIERGATSQITHVFIQDSASTTGAGKTGLTFNSAGLKIVVMRPGESGPTKYLQSAGNIEDITTLGTYAAPTASKCRFKEIDATDLPGWYEIHFADALYNTTSSRRSLGGMISGAAGTAPTPFQLQLADPVRGIGSPTALPNAAAEAAGGLYTRGTGAGQINQPANGQIDSNAVSWGGTAVAAAFVRASIQQVLGVTITEGAGGRLAGAFSSFFNVAAPTLTTASVNQTGDNYSRLGAPASASIAADIATANAGITTTNGRLTAARAGYLDNLNVAGVIATQADINALNQSASRRVILTTVGQYERPETGTTNYTIEARTYDGDGAPTNADSTPSLTADGITSGNLSANLSAATNPATGVYRWTYTVAAAATKEQIRYDLTATIGATAFPMSVYSQIVDYVAATWTTTDQTNLTTLAANYTATRAAKLDNLDAAITSRASATDYTPTRAAKLDNLDAAITTRLSQSYAEAQFISILSSTSNIATYLGTEIPAIKAKTDNLPASPAATGDEMALTPTERTTTADAILKRGATNTEATAETLSLTTLILAGFESERSGDTWTIKRTNGTTHLTRTLTSDPAAEPITAVT